MVVNQSFIFHLPFPSPRTKNKRGCCARVARSDLYSLVPVVSCSCLTSLCVKLYASATVSLNILYNQIVRHCTGGESGIRTHDTEGRILALPATICSEMTGFRP